jgi:hypothetical protein
MLWRDPNAAGEDDPVLHQQRAHLALLGEGVMTDECKGYEAEAESRWSELYRAWLKNQAAWAAQPNGIEASRLRDECVDLVVKNGGHALPGPLQPTEARSYRTLPILGSHTSWSDKAQRALAHEHLATRTALPAGARESRSPANPAPAPLSPDTARR